MAYVAGQARTTHTHTHTNTHTNKQTEQRSCTPQHSSACLVIRLIQPLGIGHAGAHITHVIPLVSQICSPAAPAVINLQASDPSLQGLGRPSQPMNTHCVRHIPAPPRLLHWRALDMPASPQLGPTKGNPGLKHCAPFLVSPRPHSRTAPLPNLPRLHSFVCLPQHSKSLPGRALILS